MSAVWAVLRTIYYILKLIVLVLLIPLILIIWSIRILINRLRFRSKLRKSGIPEEWVKKLSSRYNLRFSDLVDLIKLARANEKKLVN